MAHKIKFCNDSVTIEIEKRGVNIWKLTSSTDNNELTFLDREQIFSFITMFKINSHAEDTAIMTTVWIGAGQYSTCISKNIEEKIREVVYLLYEKPKL